MLPLTGALFPQGAAGGLQSPPQQGWEGDEGITGEPQTLAGLLKGSCLCAMGALVFVRSWPSPLHRLGGGGVLTSPPLSVWNVLLMVWEMLEGERVEGSVGGSGQGSGAENWHGDCMDWEEVGLALGG